MSRSRRSRVVRVVSTAALLVWVAAASARAQATDRADGAGAGSGNAPLLTSLLEGSMSEAVGAARALGEQKNPLVGDLLARLYARTDGNRAARYRLLLRMVLERVFLLPEPAPARIAANEPSLAVLVGALQSIRDPATRRALLLISLYLPSPAVEKPLLEEGNFLLLCLQRSQGRLGPERLAEAFGFLDACAAHTNSVLRDEVIALIRLSRDASFVRQARSYLAQSE